MGPVLTTPQVAVSDDASAGAAAVTAGTIAVPKATANTPARKNFGVEILIVGPLLPWLLAGPAELRPPSISDVAGSVVKSTLETWRFRHRYEWLRRDVRGMLLPALNGQVNGHRLAPLIPVIPATPAIPAIPVIPAISAILSSAHLDHLRYSHHSGRGVASAGRKVSYGCSIIGGMSRGVEQLSIDTAALADTSLLTLPDDELIDELQQLYRRVQSVTAIMLRAVREVDSRDLAKQRHFSRTAALLRQYLLIDSRTARDLVTHARLLDQDPTLQHAVLNGAATIAQAAVIGEALDTLTSTGDRDHVPAARTALLDMAQRFGPYQLSRLGTRILDHVAPQVGEEADRKALQRQERRARRRRGLTIAAPFDGTARISGYLTVEDTAIINAALDPLCRPTPNDERNPEQTRADALTDICRLALRTGQLPDNGGEPPQIIITIPYDDLTTRATEPAAPHYRQPHPPPDDREPDTPPCDAEPDTPPRDAEPDTPPRNHQPDAPPQDGQSGAPPRPPTGPPTRGREGDRPSGARPARSGTRRPDRTTATHAGNAGNAGNAGRLPGSGRGYGLLDNGERLSPETVRRLACDAHIIPAVLDGHGQPLDLGRSRRLFTGPIRRAMALRDGGCAFPDCDRPTKWCDGHHITGWLDDGPTSLTNGVLLCRRHHTIIHKGRWQVRIGADGHPEFLPPPELDPTRHPRRNLYRQRT